MSLVVRTLFFALFLFGSLAHAQTLSKSAMKLLGNDSKGRACSVTLFYEDLRVVGFHVEGMTVQRPPKMFFDEGANKQGLTPVKTSLRLKEGMAFQQSGSTMLGLMRVKGVLEDQKSTRQVHRRVNLFVDFYQGRFEFFQELYMKPALVPHRLFLDCGGMVAVAAR